MGSQSSNKKKQNEWFEIEKSDVNKDLGLKIHICGDNCRKNDVIKQLFYIKKISDKQYIKRASREFKTEQFYWIATLYENFTDNTVREIMDDIISDRDNRPSIKQQVILCFISEDNKNLLSSFNTIRNDLYTPLIIIVSEKKIELLGNIDKRRITNIIYKKMGNEELKNRIISALWDCDYYYNEKGTKVCSYIPQNLFKSLDTKLPFKSVNILLTGKVRSGKSAFINVLSNKLIAFESSERISVTQSINEYYVYSNNNDDKYDDIAIKLIDTPGIVKNNIEKSKELLNNLLNNQEYNMEKQMHFILFFFMEMDSLEGLDDIFNLLNNCNIQVLFIINRALDDSDNGKTKDITSTIAYLSWQKFYNLINRDNYIGINIVGTKRIPCFGVEDIFKRLYDIYKEKNKFNVEIENNIKEYRTNYYSEILENNEEINNELMKKIDQLKKELDKEIYMFKSLNIDSIIKNGRIHAIRLKNVINSLTNISGKVNNFEYDNIPAISFFQAFMVIKIGEIFGFNTKEMNYYTKLYIKQIQKKLGKEHFSFQKKDIIKTIELKTNVIENQIKKELEKSNKDLIINLSKIFMEIKEKYKDKHNNEKISEDILNRTMTDAIYLCCINHIEEQLKKTNGLLFWGHYYDICHQILNLFEKFAQKDSYKWAKKEMKIIEEE